MLCLSSLVQSLSEFGRTVVLILFCVSFAKDQLYNIYQIKTTQLDKNISVLCANLHSDIPGPVNRQYAISCRATTTVNFKAHDYNVLHITSDGSNDQQQ